MQTKRHFKTIQMMHSNLHGKTIHVFKKVYNELIYDNNKQKKMIDTQKSTAIKAVANIFKCTSIELFNVRIY